MPAPAGRTFRELYAARAQARPVLREAQERADECTDIPR